MWKKIENLLFHFILHSCNPSFLLLAIHSRYKTITQTHDLLSSHAELVSRQPADLTQLKLASGRRSHNTSFGARQWGLLPTSLGCGWRKATVVCRGFQGLINNITAVQNFL